MFQLPYNTLMPDDVQKDDTPPQPGQVITQQQADPNAENVESPKPEEEKPSTDADNSITWSASEFIAHNKGAGWFFGLGALIVLIAALVYVLTKSIFSSVMIVLIGIIFGVAARRQPKVVNYTLSSTGVGIGEKFFPYSEFKSFSVVEEGAFRFVSLISFKRFVPAIGIYYEPNDEEKILETISTYLPHEETSKDFVEHLMHRIKF